MLARISLDLLLIFLLMSCKKQVESSEVKHIFGKTAVTRNSPLADCKAEAREAELTNAKLAKAYSEKILDLIIERNNQSSQVFTGYLARSSFCVSILPDPVENAHANSINGHITINASLFAAVDSDAAFAGVIGHELAHVTLNHSDTESSIHTFSRLTAEERILASSLIKEAVILNQSLITILKSITKIYDVSKIKTDQIENRPFEEIGIFIENEVIKNKLCRDQCVEFKKLMKEAINKHHEYELPAASLIKIYSKYYTKAELANKREADADEIGYEFIVRADIDPDSYTNFGRFAAKKYQDIENCDFGLDSDFNRGADTHPSSCWRIENIYQESQKHRADYEKYLIKKSIHLIDSPSLESVKAEMAQLLSSGKKKILDPLPSQTPTDNNELPSGEVDPDTSFLKQKR